MTGATIFLQTLEKLGVDTIFGYPGGAVLPIYDALYKNKKIRHIKTVHEQGAAHAADGYARATGKVGVALSTSGPGAINMATGIANAYMDSAPVVFFTGQVAQKLLGKDSFQEVDITGVTLPITKHNFIIRDKRDIVKKITQAFTIAAKGRPGPVLVDLPKDVMEAKIETTKQTRDINGFMKTYIQKQNRSSDIKKCIKKVVSMIEKSEKPLIYAGGGVINSEACEELKTFAKLIDAPVATTLMGISAFPTHHPLSLGMLGMHGTAYANKAVMECDLLIALGTRFNDRVTGEVEKFAPQAKIIHVDIDLAELGKNVRVDLGIKADIKELLKCLIPNLTPKKQSRWKSQVNQWKKLFPLKYSSKGLKPQFIIQEINRQTQGDAIITTEVGQHQMWAAQFYKFKNPRTFISSGGLGTMGFGLPAAIGAKIGRPDKKVFNIAGDGSFEMNCHELITASNYNIPVITVILNNRSLGMVRQWQELFYSKRYSHVKLSGNTDYVKLAQGCGVKAFRITHKREVADIISEAMEEKGPVVIDARVEPEENVIPMVPAGGTLNKMLGVNFS